ncbi:GRAM domain-containing protein 4 [Trichonephila clavipes]|nr:GRAM domain-containing protein 4 [Trichonephila clavipes]
MAHLSGSADHVGEWSLCVFVSGNQTRMLTQLLFSHSVAQGTYIFGAILNRDETLESIMEAGLKAGLSWASAPLQPDHEEPQQSCSTKKPGT